MPSAAGVVLLTRSRVGTGFLPVQEPVAVDLGCTVVFGGRRRACNQSIATETARIGWVQG